jgi:uncharacterized protein with HEPN domain
MLSLRNYLMHIREEIDFVLRHTNTIDKNTFLSDETLTRAIVRSLEIITFGAAIAVVKQRKSYHQILNQYIHKLNGKK